jgi:tRNA dimethylallyltransferase
LEELREKDPATFEKIDRQNPRRVIRAVEVIRLTGKKFSEQRADWKAHSAASPEKQPSDVPARCRNHIICLTRPSADLHQRISLRVDEMFVGGLVEETRTLLPRGLAENIFAMQAIGYRQVVEHLRGERGLPETIELVKSRTRYLAKRQMTWFRRHGNCSWLELNPETSSEAIVERCMELFTPD